jgi:hypothetical protein
MTKVVPRDKQGEPMAAVIAVAGYKKTKYLLQALERLEFELEGIRENE